MQVLNKFQQFIRQNDLFSKEDKILVAVSGGVDSIALVHLMSSSGYDFDVAHCNFQLRGNESEQDQQFVMQVAAEKDISCLTKRFNTKEYAKAQKLSIQLAARELRYEWFQSLCIEHGYERIATAHHASDQTETVIYNIIKGCGISGLRGIPIRNNNIVRPLLFASRSEIVCFAKEHEIEWREDLSNNDEKYNRNLLRHSVVPKLKSINPSIDKTMNRNTGIYADIEAFVKNASEKILKNHSKKTNNNTLVLETIWLSDEPGSKVILYEIVQKYKFNYDQLSNIFDSISKSSGRKFYSQSHLLVVDREKIYISPIDVNYEFELTVEADDPEFHLMDVRFEMQIIDKDKFEIIRTRNVACLDYDRLSFPLEVRNWQEGDKFYPLGMESKKKVSDFMIDEKIPVNLKGRVPLVVSAGEIAWIAGYRIDDRFKITSLTKKILMIEKIDV